MSFLISRKEYLDLSIQEKKTFPRGGGGFSGGSPPPPPPAKRWRIFAIFQRKSHRSALSPAAERREPIRFNKIFPGHATIVQMSSGAVWGRCPF